MQAGRLNTRGSSRASCDDADFPSSGSAWITSERTRDVLRRRLSASKTLWRHDDAHAATENWTIRRKADESAAETSLDRRNIESSYHPMDGNDSVWSCQ